MTLSARILKKLEFDFQQTVTIIEISEDGRLLCSSEARVQFLRATKGPQYFCPPEASISSVSSKYDAVGHCCPQVHWKCISINDPALSLNILQC